MAYAQSDSSCARALLAYNRGAAWEAALGEKLYSEWSAMITTLGSIFNERSLKTHVIGKFLWDTVRGQHPDLITVVCKRKYWRMIVSDVCRVFRISSVQKHDDYYDISIYNVYGLTLRLIRKHKIMHFDSECLYAPVITCLDMRSYSARNGLSTQGIIERLRKGTFVFVHEPGKCVVTSKSIAVSRKYLNDYGLCEHTHGRHQALCAARFDLAPMNVFSDEMARIVSKANAFPYETGTVIRNGVRISPVLHWIMNRAVRHPTRNVVLAEAAEMRNKLCNLKLVSAAEFDITSLYAGTLLHHAFEDIIHKHVFVDIGTGYGETHEEAWRRVIRELDNIAETYDNAMATQPAPNHIAKKTRVARRKTRLHRVTVHL